MNGACVENLCAPLSQGRCATHPECHYNEECRRGNDCPKCVSKTYCLGVPDDPCPQRTVSLEAGGLRGDAGAIDPPHRAPVLRLRLPRRHQRRVLMTFEDWEGVTRTRTVNGASALGQLATPRRRTSSSGAPPVRPPHPLGRSLITAATTGASSAALTFPFAWTLKQALSGGTPERVRTRSAFARTAHHRMSCLANGLHCRTATTVRTLRFELPPTLGSDECVAVEGLRAPSAVQRGWSTRCSRRRRLRWRSVVDARNGKQARSAATWRGREGGDGAREVDDGNERAGARSRQLQPDDAVRREQDDGRRLLMRARSSPRRNGTDGTDRPMRLREGTCTYVLIIL